MLYRNRQHASRLLGRVVFWSWHLFASGQRDAFIGLVYYITRTAANKRRQFRFYETGAKLASRKAGARTLPEWRDEYGAEACDNYTHGVNEQNETHHGPGRPPAQLRLRSIRAVYAFILQSST